MKKIFLFSVFVLSSIVTFAQIQVQTEPNVSISKENPFLDASNYNTFLSNEGKGLYFPRTDLTTWEFKTASINPGNFASYYDGFVVYNTATGSTGSNAATQGKVVAVEPGFYYFSNPGQSFPTGNLNNGTWKPLSAAGASLPNYSTTEVNTGRKWVDNKDVYMAVFVYNQATTTPVIDFTGFTPAADINQIIGCRIIPQNPADGIGVVSNLKSYDKTNKKGIVGSFAGNMSTALAAGDYQIILEYTK